MRFDFNGPSFWCIWHHRWCGYPRLWKKSRSSYLESNTGYLKIMTIFIKYNTKMFLDHQKILNRFNSSILYLLFLFFLVRYFLAINLINCYQNVSLVSFSFRSVLHCRKMSCSYHVSSYGLIDQQVKWRIWVDHFSVRFQRIMMAGNLEVDLGSSSGKM